MNKELRAEIQAESKALWAELKALDAYIVGFRAPFIVGILLIIMHLHTT